MMAPCKRQLKATRHLICGSCSNWVDFVKSGCEKSWAEVQADSFSFECPKNISETGYICVCLNARSIVNKKNELNIMVEDTDPHMIGITESWANIDITDAELGLTGYVMFRKYRIGRRGGGVILYVKESIEAYVIKLEREADCDEAVWCKIVSGNSKLTIGLVYRSPKHKRRGQHKNKKRYKGS